jgi:hypothetical protein
MAGIEYRITALGRNSAGSYDISLETLEAAEDAAAHLSDVSVYAHEIVKYDGTSEEVVCVYVSGNRFSPDN